MFSVYLDIWNLLPIDKFCSIWKTYGHSCWLYWNVRSGGRWMHSKYLNRINFPNISAKVEKAASRKGQMKLLLLEVYAKWGKCEPLVTMMLKPGANNIDIRVKMFKGKNLEKNQIQLNSVQWNMKEPGQLFFKLGVH